MCMSAFFMFLACCMIAAIKHHRFLLQFKCISESTNNYMHAFQAVRIKSNIWVKTVHNLFNISKDKLYQRFKSKLMNDFEWEGQFEEKRKREFNNIQEWTGLSLVQAKCLVHRWPAWKKIWTGGSQSSEEIVIMWCMRRMHLTLRMWTYTNLITNYNSQCAISILYSICNTDFYLKHHFECHKHLRGLFLSQIYITLTISN